MRVTAPPSPPHPPGPADAPGAAPRRLYFQQHTVDLARRALFRDGVEVHLHPRAFDTMMYLLTHPGRVLAKDELLQAIWPDVVVGENNLAQSIRELREALGDDAQHPVFIRTVPRRGYLFLPEVTANRPPEAAGAGSSTGALRADAHNTPAEAAFTRIGRPAASGPGRRGWATAAMAVVAAAVVVTGVWAMRQSAAAKAGLNPVAVVAFRVVGAPAAPRQSGLAWLDRGLVDMVTTDLAQDHHLRLISYARVLDSLHRDARRHPGGAPDPLALARGIGARTMVTGTFVSTGGEFQLDLEAVRVRDGVVIASLQTQGAGRGQILGAVDHLCGLLRGQLTGTAAPAAPSTAIFPTRSLAAYRLYLAGLDDLANAGRHSLARAAAELRQALGLDPHFALAAVTLAQVLAQERFWGYPVSGPAPRLPPAAKLSPPVRLLAAARLDGKLPLAERRADLQTLVDRYASFTLEEGVPIDLVHADWALGDTAAAIRTGQHFAADPILASFYRANLDDELGRLYQSLGQYHAAIQAITAAEAERRSKTGTGYWEHRYWLGRMEFDAGRRQTALDIYAQIRPHALAAESGPLLSDLAWGYYFAGQRAQSATLVRRALTASPQWWNAWHLAGWLALTGRGAAHEPSLAAQDFARAYRLSPHGDLPSLYYEGVALEQAGRRAQARAVFRRLRQAANAGDWATAALSRHNPAVRAVTLALADAQLGQRDRARAEAAAAERLSGGDGDQLYACAQAYAVAGEPVAALATLRAALAHGYRNYQHIRDNPAFAGALQPRVAALLAAAG